MLSSNVHFSHRDAGSTGTLLPLSKFLHQKGFSSCYWKGWGKQTKCKCKPYLSGLLPMPLCFRLGFSAWMPELFMSVLYDRDSLRRKKKTNLSLDVMVANKQHLFCYVLPSFSFMTGTLFEALDLRYLDSFTFKTMPLLCVAGLAVQSDSATSFGKGRLLQLQVNFSTTPTFCAVSSTTWRLFTEFTNALLQLLWL